MSAISPVHQLILQVTNNVSSCTEISLNHGDLKLAPIDQTSLSLGLKKNTFLKKLEVTNVKFTKTTALGEALKINRSLQELTLRFAEVGDVQVPPLAEALKVNTTLTLLNLSKCNLAYAIELAEVLKVNRVLQRLDLSYNEFSDFLVERLTGALKVNSTLKDLILFKCHLTNIMELTEALKVNSALQILDLGCNEFGNAGGRALVDALKVNTSLTDLSLPCCELKEIAELAEVLKTNRFLKALNLGSNQFGNAGGQALAGALKVNTTLTLLNLYSCKLTNVTELAEALKVNRALQTLILSSNKIGNAGGRALASVLKYNTTLTFLQLGSCALTNVTELTEALKKNRSLQTLGLDCNSIDNTGGEALASVLLEVNTTLTTLDLAKCRLTNVIELAKALKKNRSLQTLELSWNRFCNAGAKELAAALEVNTTLTNIGTTLTNIGLDCSGLSSEAAAAINKKIEYNKSLAIQRKQVDEKERKAQAAAGIHPANAQPMMGGMLDAEVVEKLRDLPGKLEVLAQRVQRLDVIDASVLQLLQSRTDQMKRLLDGQDQVDRHNLEKARIDESAALQTYYQFFSRLLTGTWMACQTINSGMVDIDEKYTSDYVGQGLDIIGKQIPGISIVTSIISGAISAWNSREKKKAVQRLALLFPDLETAFRELSQLARQATLAQEKEIHSLPPPKGIAAKIKEAFKDAKAFVLGDDANDPLRWKAVEDCTKLLTAIKEGKLPEKPTRDDLLSTIMGKGFKYQQPVLAPASPAASSPPRAVPSASPTPSPSASPTMQQPDLMEMIEELRRMKEREAAREAELKMMREQMSKLQSQLPDDDSVEIGNDQAQVLISKSRQAASAASASSLTNPRVAAELIDGTRRLEVEVAVIKARLELHSDVIETNKASLEKVQRDLRRK